MSTNAAKIKVFGIFCLQIFNFEDVKVIAWICCEYQTMKTYQSESNEHHIMTENQTSLHQNSEQKYITIFRRRNHRENTKEKLKLSEKTLILI